MDDVTEIREGVHLTRGSNTNRVNTLVDTGCPGDRERVIVSVDVLPPGHGPAHDGSAATAAEQARRLASA
jgi:hypothetical protein